MVSCDVERYIAMAEIVDKAGSRAGLSLNW